jgi:hypothetical protein
MNIRRYVLLVLTVLAFFVSILEALPQKNIFEYVNKTLKSPSGEMKYEPLDLGADQKFCRAFDNAKGGIDVDFTVNITTLSNRYTNIFQTDDLNKGLRLEISPEGKLNAFVASPDGAAPDKVIGVLSNGVIKPKTLTEIRVSVYSNTVGLSINGGPVAAQEANFSPTCTRVLVGGGYDSSRSAIGNVQATVNVQETKYKTTFGLPMQVRTIARIIFTLLLVAVLWEFRKKIFAVDNNEAQ